MKHEHECHKAGCKFREKQPRSDAPKNIASRERMALVQSWNKEHGIEHIRNGCTQRQGAGRGGYKRDSKKKRNRRRR